MHSLVIGYRGPGTKRGSFYSTGDKFDLIGTSWAMAGYDGKSVRFLPGHIQSKSSDWTVVPSYTGFMVVAGDSCPDNSALPDKIHVCLKG